MDRKNFLIRPIERNDINSVVELLQSISDYTPSKSEYSSIWSDLCKQSNAHALVAIVDKHIVGYGTIIFETKIRGGKMGHVEDIVSHSNYRKKGIGMAILDALHDLAKANGCFKIALQCKEHNIDFYKKCNYELSGVAMQIFVD